MNMKYRNISVHRIIRNKLILKPLVKHPQKIALMSSSYVSRSYCMKIIIPNLILFKWKVTCRLQSISSPVNLIFWSSLVATRLWEVFSNTLNSSCSSSTSLMTGLSLIFSSSSHRFTPFTQSLHVWSRLRKFKLLENEKAVNILCEFKWGI